MENLQVDEFIDGLLNQKDATEQPSDTQKPEDITMRIPEWYDEKLYNKGRHFYWNNCFQFSSSMLVGLVAVFSVPSILRVLISSRRSNSIFTSYKRYLSTVLHTISWFEHDLKPGTVSWRSLMTVRSRHLKASIASKMKGQGIISQRDLALTQFGFFGFAMLKPDKFGIRQLEPGDWEAYNHFWRTIGYVIGLEDKYNICRKNFEETRAVCKIILERVFTPCLDVVPEGFEHMTRTMLDSMRYVNPTIDVEALLYWTKYLAGVPGYIYSEGERAELQDTLRAKLKGRSNDIGVDTAELLLSKPAIEISPRTPRLIYLQDYETIESIPEYQRLDLTGRYKLTFNYILGSLYTSFIFRWFINLNFFQALFLMKYLPYLAFFKFGITASYVNIFKEDPVDDTVPKPNSEYTKPRQRKPFYKEILSFLW
ncbi:uncharacterized protein LOC126966975 [Leptidea sinapis]|uniref:uncharacterized protein LOC126966975 n=1 Tax=Leptidea sinapis TaxID=189913 RepID=UPI00213EEEF6|nr:uncharacterized protein LOC126966975 [Leptidea sinapis]